LDTGNKNHRKAKENLSRCSQAPSYFSLPLSFKKMTFLFLARFKGIVSGVSFQHLNYYRACWEAEIRNVEV
jgi:hypothetical protein